MHSVSDEKTPEGERAEPEDAQAENAEPELTISEHTEPLTAERTVPLHDALQATTPMPAHYSPHHYTAHPTATTPEEPQSVEDAEEPPRWGGQRRLLLIAAVVIILLGSVLVFVRAVAPDQPSAAEVFGELEAEGREWTEVRQEVREAGVGDGDYSVLEPEGLELDPSVDLLVEEVEIAGDDEVTVTLEPHLGQLIESQDLVGTKWPAAQDQLAELGLEYEQDYEVVTDGGTVYIGHNWSVADIDADVSTPQVLLTNDVRNSVQETADDFGSWSVDRWDDLRNWDPRESWEDAQDWLGDLF